MSNLNQFIAQGNLVEDPKVMGQDNNVVRFTMAINTGFGDRRKTTFIKCVGFGKQAEVMGKHLTKGKQILIRGALMPNDYTNDAGEKKYGFEIHLENVNGFYFVGNAGHGVSGQDGGDETMRARAVTESEPLF